MSPATRKILEQVASWPQEDQDELAEVAREIEARRTGVYVLSDDEKKAVEEGLTSGLVPEAEVVAFWKRFGIE